MPSTTRQALLQALSAAGGAYISGQQLAGQLGVSRAAVHKAAAALTAQGYALEAVSRRGYRLLGGDPFCAEAVGPYPAPVQVYDTLPFYEIQTPPCAFPLYPDIHTSVSQV